MRRQRHALVRYLAVGAGVGILLFAGGHLWAQTSGPGSSMRVRETSAPRQDETGPRLSLGPNGEIFRLWRREGDLRAGGGTALLAKAQPKDAPGSDAWQTLIEVRFPEKGVNALNPDLSVAQSGALAVVYQMRVHDPRSKQIRLSVSPDGGKTWSHGASSVDTSGRAFSPRAAWGRGGSLVVVWEDERRSNRLFDVYARRSPDGGKTWEPEQHLSRFPQQLPTDIYARPVLLSDGENSLWTVWVGVRGERSALYLSRSTDGGRTWADPVALSGDSRSVFGQQLVKTGDRMLLIWHDTRTSRDRIYAVSSTDSGATWTSPVRVDHLPEGSAADAVSPSVLLGPDGEALVAWHDRRNSREDVFLGRSTDGGRTWSAEDRRMDMDEAGTAVSRFPKLARSKDGRIAIIWEDDREGFEAIYLRIRGTGARADWGPEMLVGTVGPRRAATLPEVLWGMDGVLHLAWEVWDHTLAPGKITKQIDGRSLPPQ